jgi:ribonuclease P protein component
MNISKTHNVSSLANRKEIRHILNKGQKLYTKFGLIFMLNIGNKNDAKVAVLVKKNTGNAIVRNRVKRRVRYFFIKHLNEFNNFNRVIFLYNYAGSVSFKNIEKTYLSAIKKQ